MDPAQVEADIAALTSAIAADSAAEGLLRHPLHMDLASSHVGPAKDDIGIAHQDELYQEQYQGRMHLEPGFQTSTPGMQPEQHPPWHQTGRSDGTAHGQLASTRAVPAGPAVRSRHVHDQPVSLDGQDDRVAQFDSWYGACAQKLHWNLWEKLMHLRCKCSTMTSCTTQVIVCARCAGHGLAMLQPLHWLVALPAYPAHACSGSA